MADERKNQAFEAFLMFLSTSRGFDFTSYKRSTLARRVNKRMEAVGIDDYAQYTDYLEAQPEEFNFLFNTILINVTSFFRDQETWDFVAKHLIPGILSSRHSGEPVRVWSAGCASGEEPYTIAMLLAEAMGTSDFGERVKIYGTDIDEEALATARAAIYTPRSVEAVPAELREKYFDRTNGNYVFRKDVRRAVIFGRHDLLQDAPISRVDLLVCRNTLMYMNSEAQGRVLARFFFALNPEAYLFLGKSESLLTQVTALTPVNLKLRIFMKTPRPDLRDRQLRYAPPTEGVYSGFAGNVGVRDASFELEPMAHIIVSADGSLAAANERARRLFGVSVGDLGRPLQDLEFSYRPLELRSLIQQAYTERRALTLTEVEWAPQGTRRRWYNVQLTPLRDNGSIIGVSVVFEDTTHAKELQRELTASKEELEHAYEELQSTNEELETTNEELQSTVEELETTNEELQSTNEELETMNEELHSTNEELETANQETVGTADELRMMNLVLERVFTNQQLGVAVLGSDMHVRAWNRRAEDLWGLRSDEAVGKHFLSLDIGLPTEALKQPILDCASDGKESAALLLDATNRRGRPIQCKVQCLPLTPAGIEEMEGVIVLMQEVAGQSAK